VGSVALRFALVANQDTMKDAAMSNPQIEVLERLEEIQKLDVRQTATPSVVISKNEIDWLISTLKTELAVNAVLTEALEKVNTLVKEEKIYYGDRMRINEITTVTQALEDAQKLRAK
jgi:hypothetical protein